MDGLAGSAATRAAGDTVAAGRQIGDCTTACLGTHTGYRARRRGAELLLAGVCVCVETP